MKMRVNKGQELIIAGYTPSPKNFDALVIGYYDGPNLIYAARTRNGFTPASRVELFKKLKPLEIAECPFANLPEKKAWRWGAGLTASKMTECRWLNPVLVAQFEFVEWTATLRRAVNQTRAPRLAAGLAHELPQPVARLNYAIDNLDPTLNSWQRPPTTFARRYVCEAHARDRGVASDAEL